MVVQSIENNFVVLHVIKILEMPALGSMMAILIASIQRRTKIVYLCCMILKMTNVFDFISYMFLFMWCSRVKFVNLTA